MLVRAKCDHYHGFLRKEGEEFDHSGPLYAHIAPVKPGGERTSKAKAGQAKAGQDGAVGEAQASENSEEAAEK